MANVLYIHGFGSNGNASTCREIKKEFTSHNIYSADFDLMNVKSTLEKIKNICNEKKIEIIIGKSLGGFYTLMHKGPQKKIVINPCVKPWIELPKLDSSLDEKSLCEMKELFEEQEKNITAAERTSVFAIFGNKDELFSYKNYFDEKYHEKSAGLQKSFYVNGMHHIDMKDMKSVLELGFEYCSMIDEYKEVFKLMPLYNVMNIMPEDENYSAEEKDLISSKIEHYKKRMNEYINKCEKIIQLN